MWLRLAVVAFFGALGCARPAVEVAPAPAPPLSPTVEVSLALPCADAVESVITAPRDLPPFGPAQRGEVVRCAIVAHLSMDDAAKELTRFTAPAERSEVTSGFTVIRVAYRARRADGAREASSVAGALVLLPDAPRAEAGVVYAHGIVGLADRCAPSRGKPVGTSIALAAAGFTLIAPDFAGLGFGAATHAFLDSDDESRSLFDAARALAKLLPPERTLSKLVFVGSTEGGHAVLAAQATARGEDLPAPIVSVVAITPMWFSATLFASIAQGEPSRKDPGERDTVASLLYFYGHGELFDGPGGGALGFRHERRGLVAALLDTRCAADLDADLKGDRPSDIFDRAFADAVSICLANRATCSPITKAWADRMRADLPAPDRAGAPIVLWAGGRDQEVTPGRTRCAIDQLRRGGLGADKLTVCVDPNANHRAVSEKNLAKIVAQVAQRTGATSDAGDCPSEANLDANGKATCAIEVEGATKR